MAAPARPLGLTLLRAMSWAEIYRRWKRMEGNDPKWRRHFRRQGFRSWTDWRQAVVVTPFDLSRRRWALYQVVDPRVIAAWSGGPFPRWIAGPYKGAQTRTIGWLALAGRTNEDRKKTKPRKLPAKIFLFGLLYRGRVVLLDGMHRSIAIAEQLQAGHRVKSEITIALAKTEKLPKLKTSLK